MAADSYRFKTSSPPRMQSWSLEHSSSPSVLVTPSCVEDIVDIVKNKEDYPSPLRAVGSGHSTTPCFEADGGTIVAMGKMNRIFDVDFEENTIRAEAGALYYDISQKLQEHGMMHYINVEIGCITAGAAAVSQTKDSSFPGEFGQLSSYVKAVKMVAADGKFKNLSACTL